jgi:hypothetical protein
MESLLAVSARYNLQSSKDGSMSESEHHSHRTDQEWRALVRGWHDALETDQVGITSQEYYLRHARVLRDMEREAK